MISEIFVENFFLRIMRLASSGSLKTLCQKWIMKHGMNPIGLRFTVGDLCAELGMKKWKNDFFFVVKFSSLTDEGRNTEPACN